MEGIIEISRLIYVVDIWCDCGEIIRIEGNNTDSVCPHCGAVYGMLPARVDGA